MTIEPRSHVPHSGSDSVDADAVTQRDSPGTASDRPVRLPAIAGYDLLQTLGRGGMGVVYKARHVQLGRVVALKMLAAGALASQELIDRFYAEARAVAQLHHPHVAQIFEVGEQDGQPFFAMEYVAGGTLDDRLDGKPSDPRHSARLVETVARAIHHCHEQGVVHRDLKPGNILLEVEDRSRKIEDRQTSLEVGESGDRQSSILNPQVAPKIADFGLAKRLDSGRGATRTGEIMGTPSYMAPEQAGGVVKSIGPACDVYALGAILYEMLAGRPPFASPDPMQTVMMVLRDDPVSLRRLQPTIPADLETICLKCLEKTPVRRYATAEALADDLRRFLDGEPIHARPVRTWERAVKWARRRPATASLIGVVAVATVGALAGVVWHNAQLQAANEAEAAERTRFEKLFQEDKALSQWLLDEHFDQLATLSGGSKPRAQLATQLLEYLSRIELHAADDLPLLDRIARAYERIGDALGNSDSVSGPGKYDDARASYRRALLLRERLVAQTNRSAQSRIDLALCRGRIAAVDDAQGGVRNALQRYERVLLAFQEIHSDFPDNPRAAKGVISSQVRVADIHQKLGEHKRAERLLMDALRRNRALPESERKKPQTKWFAASIDAQVGTVLEAANRLKEAEDYYSRVLQFARSAQGPGPYDASRQHFLSIALLKLGDIQSRRDDKSQAAEAYRESLRIRRRHYNADRDSPTAQHALFVILERLGTLHTIQNDYSRALPLFQEAAVLLDRAGAPRPDDVSALRDRAILLGKLGVALLREREVDAAEERFIDELRLAKQLLSANRNSGLQRVAEAQSNLGNVEVLRVSGARNEDDKIARWQAALAHYRRSREYWKQLEKVAVLTRDQQRLVASIEQRIRLVELELKKLVPI